MSDVWSMRSNRASAAAVLSAINAQTGSAYTLGDRLPGGTRNAGAWLVDGPEGPAVLKWVPGESSLESQQAAARACERLSRLGAPVPTYRSVGTVSGGVYAVMDFMRGRTMNPGSPRQVRELLSLVELQKDQGFGASGWPAQLVDRIMLGDGNYSYPGVMEDWSPEARHLLERCCDIARRSRSIACRTSDIVHQDMNPGNVLAERGRISGIIDWENTTTGDHAWDVTEILFCAWEKTNVRGLIWDRLCTLTSGEARSLFCADMAVGFASGAMVHQSSEWANRCVRVGNELLNACGPI
jgi:aminoglycoside phosphotransferase (APT) family kinase protein